MKKIRFPEGNYIKIKGARENNLKNIDLVIPTNQLIVFTGRSGSGKSSLVMDTLFGEGQRGYAESLSTYSRQFIHHTRKAKLDSIENLLPAISVDQTPAIRTSRSTVGTATEIYDYLKIILTQLGKTYSPITGKRVRKYSPSSIAEFVQKLKGQEFVIACPLPKTDEELLEFEKWTLNEKGFNRGWIKGKIIDIEKLSLSQWKNASLLIDKGVVSEKMDQERLHESIRMAMLEGDGVCRIHQPPDKMHVFSDKFELDGISFLEPTPNLFTFNNNYGACPNCKGTGKGIGFDENLIIPDPQLSITEGAILPWRSPVMKRRWLLPLLETKNLLPLEKSYQEWTPQQKKTLWEEKKNFRGINSFLEEIQRKRHKVQYRVLSARYTAEIPCTHCQGLRLRKEATYIKMGGYNIHDLVRMTLIQLKEFFDDLLVPPIKAPRIKNLFRDLKLRLEYLDRVGVGYLSLQRPSASLSGGEYQRLRLATCIGSSLVGTMYVLDEPTIGLHPRDVGKLMSLIQDLKSIGNTVIVVEHEEEVIRKADMIIDLGPGAGTKGGYITFQGNCKDFLENTCETAQYLNGKKTIPIPPKSPKTEKMITLKGLRQNNLKNINAKFPLNSMVLITGVSGSGKSTLVHDALYPLMLSALRNKSSSHDSHIVGPYADIDSIERIDQNPMGKNIRFYPVSYVKAYDPIRKIFAQQSIAKQRGFKAGHFSLSSIGGRCEECKGEGKKTVEMQFLPSISLTCNSCKGKRFRSDTLEIKYKGKNIYEVLNMTVQESLVLFQDQPNVLRKLEPLKKVGLGYIKLGQPGYALSGGEAQRVKLASFLAEYEKREHTLFIFDEPTVGLHYADIVSLLEAFRALIEQGHSVIIIEHNMEVVKTADWIIDLGPEGGEKGGHICFQGKPEDMINLQKNHTLRFLKNKLK
ncbi:MAG: excinuclease ABC subunit UvrA [Cytophagales bacterium]|nr:excinuclease ABC subunit UvrA [Cytophagales bacterium]